MRQRYAIHIHDTCNRYAWWWTVRSALRQEPAADWHISFYFPVFEPAARPASPDEPEEAPPDAPELPSPPMVLPTEGGGQSALTVVSSRIPVTAVLPVAGMPLLLSSMLRAMAPGHLIGAPEAEVPGVCEPPVDPGEADDGLPSSGVAADLAASGDFAPALDAPGALGPVGDEDCADAMPAVAISAARSVIDGNIFIFISRKC
jgi:hypothetical protein